MERSEDEDEGDVWICWKAAAEKRSWSKSVVMREGSRTLAPRKKILCVVVGPLVEFVEEVEVVVIDFVGRGERFCKSVSWASKERLIPGAILERYVREAFVPY